MKYAGSKPPTEWKASRSTRKQEPESQPAVRSRGASRSRRYRAVQGLAGQIQPSAACPMPVESDGRSRADG